VPAAAQIAAALPMPVLLIAQAGEILFANPAAEAFFGSSANALSRQKLAEIVPFGSPLISAAEQARARGAWVGERDIDLSLPRHGERMADVTATPVTEPEGAVLLTLHERSFAQRLDRQLLHRGAVRSLNGMAAVLAHEIKNPLAGIRGAAQLLEDAVPAGERGLTELICAESDRISALIDRMESFGSTRPTPRAPVNIHEVLGRVRQVAVTSFARAVKFVEVFDPSLPEVAGDRDELIQVFLNLVRNASDAVPETGGEITLTSAYRPGMRVSTGAGPVSLPLEITVRDNGTGVPADILPFIFDPFITTKPRGSGLGLALVAKIVGDHGGVIECESVPGRTIFRVLLPKAGEA
jgi:two-component system nitrogen regulation sensor histidine kinase GlnL